MEKYVTFVRLNKNNLEYENAQKVGIKNYVKEHNIELNSEMEIEVNIPKEEENIEMLVKNCNKTCTVIVYDLNVFGRTIESILNIVKYLLDNSVRVISINQNLDLMLL